MLSATNLKVLAIEWIEPFFTAGHWIPEMIENAGGRNLISSIGEHSRTIKYSKDHRFRSRYNHSNAMWF